MAIPCNPPDKPDPLRSCIREALDVLDARLRFAHCLRQTVVGLGFRVVVNLRDRRRFEDAGREHAFLEQRDAIGSPVTRGAPLDDEWPYKRDTLASSMNGRRSSGNSAMRALDGEPARDGIVAIDDFAGDAERLAAVDDAFSQACWLQCGVEMPQPLFMTMISTGSSLPGRLLQIRQEAKSPSAVPASPPTTMVTPSPPCASASSAVPGAIAYCTSITELTGTTFQSRLAKWPGNCGPWSAGRWTVMAIWRMPSIRSACPWRSGWRCCGSGGGGNRRRGRCPF